MHGSLGRQSEVCFEPYHELAMSIPGLSGAGQGEVTHALPIEAALLGPASHTTLVQPVQH